MTSLRVVRGASRVNPSSQSAVPMALAASRPILMSCGATLTAGSLVCLVVAMVGRASLWVGAVFSLI